MLINFLSSFIKNRFNGKIHKLQTFHVHLSFRFTRLFIFKCGHPPQKVFFSSTSKKENTKFNLY
jgi:hypothetical protein